MGVGNTEDSVLEADEAETEVGVVGGTEVDSGAAEVRRIRHHSLPSFF